VHILIHETRPITNSVVSASQPASQSASQPASQPASQSVETRALGHCSLSNWTWVKFPSLPQITTAVNKQTEAPERKA